MNKCVPLCWTSFSSGKVHRRVRRSQKLRSTYESGDFEEPKTLMGKEVQETEYCEFGHDYKVTRSLVL